MPLCDTVKCLQKGERNAPCRPRDGGKWNYDGSYYWPETATVLVMVRGLEVRVRNKKEIVFEQTSGPFKGCSSVFSWNMKICSSCECSKPAGLVDVSVTHVFNDDSGAKTSAGKSCASWFIKVDAAARSYLTSTRAGILVSKVLCCSGAKRNDEWRDQICRKSKFKTGPVSTATKARRLGEAGGKGGMLSVGTFSQLIKAKQTAPATAAPTHKAASSSLGDKWEDITSQVLQKQKDVLESKCKRHVIFEARFYNIDQGMTLISKVWKKYKLENPPGLQIKNILDKGELAGKFVCMEDTPSLADHRSAYSALMGRYYLPPKVVTSTTGLEVSCGGEEVQLDQISLTEAEPVDPQFTSKCYAPDGKDITGKMECQFQDGGKIQMNTAVAPQQLHMWKGRGWITNADIGPYCCCSWGGSCKGKYGSRASSSYWKGKLKPGKRKNLKGKTSTCCPPTKFSLFNMDEKQWTPWADKQACFRQEYGDTSKCKTKMTLKIEQCKGCDCTSTDGKRTELVKFSTTHTLVEGGAGCQPWFTFVDAGTRSLIGNMRKKVVSDKASSCGK